MFEKLKFPNRITIEVTNRCNISCTFCPRQNVQMELGDMSKKLFYKIINEASQYLPVKIVIFFRGEPFMHPNLIEYIKYAKSKGLGPIQLASNALLLDENMGQQLIESGVDFISFSLDTMDVGLYKESRLYGDLNMSMNNVKQFGLKCRAYREKGYDTPTVQVSTIDLPIYKEKQEEFISFWRKYVDIVRVYYEHDEKGHIVDSDIKEMLIKDIERKPCRKVFTDMLIYWNGDIALCNYDWEEKLDWGNVSHKSLYEVWNSKEYEEIRNMHTHNKFNENILCKDCDHWKIDYTPKGYLGKLFEGEKSDEQN